MTVKELKEILDACNQDAEVFVVEENGALSPIHDSQVFHVVERNQVTIDPSYGDES